MKSRIERLLAFQTDNNAADFGKARVQIMKKHHRNSNYSFLHYNNLNFSRKVEKIKNYSYLNLKGD